MSQAIYTEQAAAAGAAAAAICGGGGPSPPYSYETTSLLRHAPRPGRVWMVPGLQEIASDRPFTVGYLTCDENAVPLAPDVPGRP